MSLRQTALEEEETKPVISCRVSILQRRKKQRLLKPPHVRGLYFHYRKEKKRHAQISRLFILKTQRFPSYVISRDKEVKKKNTVDQQKKGNEKPLSPAPRTFFIMVRWSISRILKTGNKRGRGKGWKIIKKNSCLLP